MIEPQSFLPIAADALLPRVRELRGQGWRLVQIGATPLGETVEINYTFDREGRLVNLRVTLPGEGAPRLPSITPVYACAFLYENELHDLFRIRVEGISVDYKGKFYRTMVPFPFAAKVPRAAASVHEAKAGPPPVPGAGPSPNP